MRREAAPLILSTAGVTILYLLSLILQPPHVTLDEIPSFEGETVEIAGVVTSVYITSSGNQIIGLRNIQNEPPGNTTIFSMDEIDVNVDDIIKAKGSVQKYEGKWEIVVHNKNNVQIIKRMSTQKTSIWVVATEPERYMSLPLSLTGEIKNLKISRNTFTLTNNGYSITVFSPPQYLFNLTTGEHVKVDGRLLYDDKTFSYYILGEKVIKVD
ncbi:MAG: hypothetical protein DRN01_02440 [Thermoplasmata archaeon]|nr:MAG: hypothetical protein DRN01_02440 [Thermoplasmata archaeon]